LNAKYKNLFEKIEKEMLAATLASIHNLYFLNSLMSKIREAILNETFHELKKDFFSCYK